MIKCYDTKLLGTNEARQAPSQEKWANNELFSVLWCWAWKMFLPYLHTHTVTQCPRNFLVIEQYELKSKHFHGQIMIPNICKSKISYFSTFLTVDTTLFLEATTLTLKDWAELIVVVQQSLMWLQGMITPRLWRWEREGEKCHLLLSKFSKLFFPKVFSNLKSK